MNELESYPLDLRFYRLICRITLWIAAILAPIVTCYFAFDWLTKDLRIDREIALILTIAYAMGWGIALVFLYRHTISIIVPARRPNVKAIIKQCWQNNLTSQFIPQNEHGIVALFAQYAVQNEIRIERIGAGFPDATICKNEEHIRVEFEYESRNFKVHKHDVNGCDLIICWHDNWPDCPLPIIALEDVYANKS